MIALLDIASSAWALLATVATAIGGAIKWYFNHKRATAQAKIAAKALSRSSTDMLYDQLEELKKALIARVEKDIERATSVAEMQHILEVFKIHCPDCYETVMSKIYPDGSPDNT